MYDRYPVVELADRHVDLGCDDGAGPSLRTVRGPRPPEAGHREQLPALDTHGAGDAAAHPTRPLVEVAPRDQAAAPLERGTEARLLGDGLRLGVDDRRESLESSIQLGEEAPPQAALVGNLFPNRRDPGVLRGDIVPRLVVERDRGVIAVLDGFERGEPAEAATQGCGPDPRRKGTGGSSCW